MMRTCGVCLNALLIWLIASGSLVAQKRFDLSGIITFLNETDLTYSIERIKRTNKVVARRMPVGRPILVKGSVYTKSTRRLLKIGVNDGKLIWEDPARPVAKEQLDARMTGKLIQRVWFDCVANQVSAGHEHVYSISATGFPIDSAARKLLRIESNILSAVDVNTGKFWYVGGADGLDEPKLANMFFLGAPLEYRGRLFCIARRGSSIILLELDSNTGGLKREATIKQISKRTVVDAACRFHAIRPIVGKCTIICPTNCGEVVAFHLQTLTRQWSYRYHRGKLVSLGQLPRSRWHSSRTITSEDRLICSTADSDHIHCMSLQSGKLIWNSKRRHLWDLDAVCHGILLAKNDKSIAGISVADGKAVWTTQISKPQGLICGSGFVDRNSLFLPTSKRFVLKIDVRTGAVSVWCIANMDLGNLLRVNAKRIIVQSESQLYMLKAE